MAALAYGTETVPQVDKIVGPGNIYVATAKKLLYGVVDIDMIAGPSEILIIADETANARYVAADLMSQAEHDVLAGAILLTNSQTLAEAVVAEIERQSADLSRREIIAKSLADYGAIVVFQEIEQMLAFADEIARNIWRSCSKILCNISARCTMPARFSSANMRRNRWAIISAGPNHDRPPAARRGSSRRCLWTALSRNTVSPITPAKRWRLGRRISSALLSARV